MINITSNISSIIQHHPTSSPNHFPFPQAAEAPCSTGNRSTWPPRRWPFASLQSPPGRHARSPPGSRRGKRKGTKGNKKCWKDRKIYRNILFMLDWYTMYIYIYIYIDIYIYIYVLIKWSMDWWFFHEILVLSASVFSRLTLDEGRLVVELMVETTTYQNEFQN